MTVIDGLADVSGSAAEDYDEVGCMCCSLSVGGDSSLAAWLSLLTDVASV